MANFILKRLQKTVNRARDAGVDRCCDWAGRQAADLKPAAILDVGCGDGSALFRYFKPGSCEFYGIEGSPECQAKAQARGFKVFSCDLNGRWPFEDNQFDVVFSNQVIEHVHNCRLFAAEAFRVLKPGGTALVTSENLCSLLNWMALTLGYTPFSLMQTCGRYLGNPLGIHYQETHSEELPLDHPAFSGVSGHVRVLTVRQARELFDLVGFQTEAHSIGILPLPDSLSRVLEGVVKHRGHFLNICARKPQGADAKLS
ncbi:MAG TPA: class I SAM-dependent methyltransferase [Verrucomicrobiae bacterium]